MRVWLVVTMLLFSSAAFADKDKDDPDKYPMSAGDYKKHLEKKLTKHRDRLEHKMKERGISPSKRDNARKALTSLETDVHKLVTEYGADQSITKNEAQAIKAKGKKGRHAIYKDLGLKFDKD